MTAKLRSYVYLGIVSSVLTACTNSDVRDSLGINREAPDEFVVVSRPPLSVPPEFELRPPRPGEAPRLPSAEAQARKELLGTESKSSTLEEDMPHSESSVAPVIASDAATGATASFLNRAGVGTADESIREKLGQDAVAAPKVEAKSLYEEIVGADKKEPVVDAKKEAERLRTNKDTGKPVTEGTTPDAKEKPPSVIDTIF
jgi:hypothetical protein